jgi:fatty-acyl-CoA synthase
LSDIEEIEKTPLEQRMAFFNTYDLLRHGTSIRPEAPAVGFVPSGDAYRNALRITYAEFASRVTQTANLFHDLGLKHNDVISYLLPNPPKTLSILWGAEAAAIAGPINPLLEHKTIAEICRAAGTNVLLAMGERPGSDIWSKAMAVRDELPDLKAVIRVMGPTEEKEGIYGYEECMGRYTGDRLNSGRVIDQ